MTDQTINCPKCQTSIPLSQALSDQIKHQLEEKLSKEYKSKADELAQEAAKVEKQKLALQEDQKKREEELALKQKALQKELEEQQRKLKQATEEQQKIVEDQVKKQLEGEKLKLWQAAQEKAREKVDTELKDLEEQFKEKAEKLEEAQKNELELRKKARELEEQQKNLDLELQRKLDEERKKIAEDVRKTEEEQFRLKLLEKDKQVEIMQKTIEDLRRQSQQGSMQIQGDVQENDIKALLTTTFFTDLITDVPTGIKGGDLIHQVQNQLGQKAGVILWESKNTKSWSNDWVTKLKQDQGAAGADICMLVTRVLPDDINGFGIKSGVWVLEPQYIVPLTTTLRMHLLELSKMKNSLVGRDQKMEYLYQYLCGTQFKNRIESIVMAFSELQKDLATEKRAMERIWRKRSQEIERVIENTAGLYGDLQGMVGAGLPSIQALELPGDEDPEINKNLAGATKLLETSQNGSAPLEDGFTTQHIASEKTSKPDSVSINSSKFTADLDDSDQPSLL